MVHRNGFTLFNSLCWKNKRNRRLYLSECGLKHYTSVSTFIKFLLSYAHKKVYNNIIAFFKILLLMVK